MVEEVVEGGRVEVAAKWTEVGRVKLRAISGHVVCTGSIYIYRNDSRDAVYTGYIYVKYSRQRYLWYSLLPWPLAGTHPVLFGHHRPAGA